MVAMEGGGGSLPTLRRKISAGKYQLYAVLIYSDTDTNFIKFLKLSHDSLATMAGKKVFLFWFEHFERDSILLWKPGDEPTDRRPMVARTDSLRLAKAFNIPMSCTPCILVCRSLEDMRTIVYSFDNSWTHEHLAEHFKAIFDHIEEALKKLEMNKEFDVYKSLENKFKALKTKK